MEGPLSCEAESGYPPPGSVGRTCPQEGKQPSQLAIVGPPAAAGSPGGCRSRPFSFLLPWAILRRRGCEDWSWAGGRTGFGFLCFVSLMLSSCFSPSLPCWPPNGKVTFPKKGEDTPKKASQAPKPLPAPLAGFSLKAARGHLQWEFCGKENKLCDGPSQTPRSSAHTKC